jgi:flagellar motor switch protein FliM
MSQALTQKEIDALLRRGSGEAASPEVVAYNFVRPPRVSKERRAALDAVFNRFAISMQGFLTSRLRVPIDVGLNGVEQANFSEFILSLASPCAAYVFTIGDRLGSQGVIEFSTDVAYQLVDRLFGGPGEPCELSRALTPLEQTVMRGIAERTLDLLREAWQDHLEMKPQLQSFEAVPDMLSIAGGGDSVLVVTFELRTGSFSGLITMCLPMSALEQPLQEKQAARQPQVRAALLEAAAGRAAIGAELRGARLGVDARIPVFSLSARDLAALAPGRVLDTGHPVDVPIELYVNDRLRFAGVLGRLRRRVAFQVTQTVATPPGERTGCGHQGRVL